jgi:hypothetical protein
MSAQLTSRMRFMVLIAAGIVVSLAAIGGTPPAPAWGAITHSYTEKSFGPEGMTSSGTPVGAFSELQSITVDQKTKDVYVYDAGLGGGSIFKFNSAGEPLEFSALHTNVIEHVGAVDSDEGELAVDSSSGPDTGDIYFASGESDGEKVLIYNPAGEPAGELSESEGKPWGEPCGVAVDPAGNVYVGLFPYHVNEYTPKSETLSNDDYVSTLSMPTSEKPVCNIAADAEGNVYVDAYDEGPVTKYPASQFNTSENPAVPAPPDPFAVAGSTLAVDPATDNVLVDETNGLTQYTPAGTLAGKFAGGGPGAVSESFGVAVDSTSGEVYVNGKTAVEIFGAEAVVPDATTGEASNETPRATTVHGTVDPDETSVIACKFEYGTGETYGHSVACSPSVPYAGSAPVAVSAELTGLEHHTTYHYRLVASNANGTSYGSDETVSTIAAYPPLASIAPVTALTANSARLSGIVNPNEAVSFYRFELSSDDGTSWVSLGEAGIAAGTEGVNVSQDVSLRADTTYQARLTAANEGGTTSSPPEAFVTPPESGEHPPSAEGCPNERIRGESNADSETGVAFSLQLPECRAYEQVTPPFKSTNVVIPGQLGNGLEYVSAFAALHAGTLAISQDGTPILEESSALLGSAGTDEEQSGTVYEILRGEGGWYTTALSPDTAEFPVSKEQLADAEDVSIGLWTAGTASEPELAANLYRRESNGNFVDIGPLAPPAATAGPPRGVADREAGVGKKEYSHAEGASSDLSDVVFALRGPSNGKPDFLWPGDGTVAGSTSGLPSLYEYEGTGHTGVGGDAPSLVGVSNTGEQLGDCGTGLGANLASPGGEVSANAVRNAVSTSGATIFFNVQAGACASGAGGPPATQLYARIGAPSSARTTVDVAGSSECANSEACNVSSAVTYQGAAKNGSRVFFTTDQPLLKSDEDTTSDIYECELPGDAGTPPAPAGVVNACPHLKSITATGSATGANVQSVLGVSEEGSRVYFTATGKLTNTPNAQGEPPQAGQDNLYLWEAGSGAEVVGHIVFVASLLQAGVSQAQATPDGQYLVFSTSADVTAGDTSTSVQAFRFSAATTELERVSVSQGGVSTNVDENQPVVLAAGNLGRTTVSEDGSYIVFQSDAALTPGVHGGIHNVYAWHNGQIGLISDGTDTDESAGLIGMDRSGTNIYFTTADKLVGQDVDDDVDVYDARIDGGFPKPALEPSCSGEACQGPLSAPLSAISPLISSTGVPAVGNLAPLTKPKPAIVKPKPPTRAEKLAKALKQCRKDRSKSKRKRCEASAKAKYGTKAKRSKKSKKHSKK